VAPKEAICLAAVVPVVTATDLHLDVPVAVLAAIKESKAATETSNKHPVAAAAAAAQPAEVYFMDEAFGEEYCDRTYGYGYEYHGDY